MGKRKRNKNQDETPLVPAVPKRVQTLVETWAEEACELYEVLLYDVVVSKGWLIRVYVDLTPDEETGIDVADLVKVSRYIEALLDEDDTLYDGYNLEVSSPGIERKLRKPRHYVLSLGKDARIVVKEPIDELSVFDGHIEAFDEIENSVELMTEKGRVKIPLSNITKAKLTFKF